ncbi:MAG: AbrB/MazE/SpoVT family DNA-binding domain-containing protein [Candidatus Bathyarchaeia archaeon]|jgi:antitoxin component of MazEF toxin-antitoxin module
MDNVIFKRTIKKWGGSAAFVFPEELMTALKVDVGSEMELSVEDGKLIAKKIPRPKGPIYT